MKKVCLIILDGWGVSNSERGNAIKISGSPNMKRLASTYPSTTLSPSGMAVGLPDGQMGNSEVGHLTLGAGRVIYQELTRINRAVDEGEIAENPVFAALAKKILARGGALHLMGLVSDGGVHSHIVHLYGILDAARSLGLERVYVHAFLDGRDTLPSSGAGFIRSLAERLAETGTGRIATVSGRYYAMDRDNRWERVVRAYDAMTSGIGEKSTGAEAAVAEAYGRGETDEFVAPTVIVEDGAPVGLISDGDGVLFFNFRGDRSRELSRAFTDRSFDGFERKAAPALAEFACLTEYESRLGLPVLFRPQALKNLLGEVLARNGVRQFRVSETEKYAHITFFFNGGREEPFEGEDRLLIPSPQDVATYDEKPEMRAPDIAEAAVERLASGQYSFMLMNFANGDMVGHTGIIEAAVAACRAVDDAVGRVVEAALGAGWSVIITSDHGNAEQMFDDHSGGVMTAHSTNPVPFILVDDDLKGVELATTGGLKDVAPTVLKVMGIAQPEEMNGEALF